MSAHFKSKFLGTVILVANLIITIQLNAAPVISEIMANNESILADIDGDFSDWIEIHNPGNADFNLEGLFLTDNADNLTKWKFPASTIGAGKYLIVFASGKGEDIHEGDGQLHTNFELSSGGEYLGLIDSDGKTIISEIAPKFQKQDKDRSFGLGIWGESSSTAIVGPNAMVKYFIPEDASLANQWLEPGDIFDDSEWMEVKHPVGFETSSGTLERLVETSIAADMKGTNASGYFRFPFQFDSINKKIVGAEIRVTIDDGFIAYINGVQIGSFNSPDQIVYNSRATGSRSDSIVASTPITIDIAPNIDSIKNGDNVLSVQAMNTTPGSSDFLLGVHLVADVIDVGGGTQYGFFKSPSPGFANSELSSQGKVADTKFSPDRGFYDEPFNLEITTKTEGATIRYTTDGSEPTSTKGKVYSSPISVTKSSIIRSAAFKKGYDSTNIDTHSYLFVNDIIRQSSSAPTGWPSGSVNGQRYQYGMNQSVVNSNNSQIGGVEKVKDALKSLPAISIVTDQANLTSARTGIYSNPQSDGIAWERESSVEMIFPPNWIDPYGNEKGFQSPCGLRIRGGYSRRTQNPKHSFRLFFRSEYGNGRLNYPIFGEEGADVFNKFDLRGPQNYSWAQGDTNRNSFIRDTWSRDLQGEMGQPYKRGRWIQLFLNGIYWGMFQIDERAEASYGEIYFGGDKDDYDVVKSYGGVTDGNRSSYQRLWQKWQQGFRTNAAYFDVQGMDPDGTINPDRERLVDIENLIDYMIITYYTGDRDGPGSRYTQPRPNNYFGIYNRENPQGYHFFEHDSEHSLGTGENNMVSPFTRSSSLTDFNPHTLHERFASHSEEYRMLFSDRVAMYCYNGGLLTAEAGIKRVDRRAEQLDSGIIAHSARWGNTSRSRTAWLGAVSGVRNFISSRIPTLVSQLRSVNWYPDIDPPKFSKHGGFVQSTQQILLRGGPGQILYTLTGDDPRQLGGGINPDAKVFDGNTNSEMLLRRGSSWKYLDNGTNAGTSWRSVAFNDILWKSGAAELGYGDGGERTTVSFGTSSLNKHVTTYFRTKFNASDVNKFGELELKLRRDDGAIVYLNGKEVVRSGMPGGTINYLTFASNISGGNDETTYYSFPIETSSLVNGQNVIAVEVHQSSRTSSDVSFDLELSGVQFTNPNPLYLRDEGLTTIKARVKNNNVWSAITEADFIVDAEPARTDNIVISEIHYRPAQPSVEEAAAGFNDRSDFEFIELLNISPRSVDLGALVFSDGIEFDFATAERGRTMLPGARLIIVNNIDAFMMRYGKSLDPNIVIVGEFKGNLNNDGEQIIITDTKGVNIIDIPFNDGDEWPASADGEGYSLVKINPLRNYANPAPSTWRSSASLGGNPGFSDALNLAEWSALNNVSDPLIDSDNDGLSALSEYAIGTDPNAVSASDSISARIGELEIEGVTDDYLIIDVKRRIGADDVRFGLQLSNNLTKWDNLTTPTSVINVQNNGNGTETVSYLISKADTFGLNVYFKAVISLSP
ncbi:lamin tail domain-containing protein [Verrucomicrobia bacterium]|nr:lamin tail domain-containing protein [Verrucomicrobiota bacterium]